MTISILKRRLNEDMIKSALNEGTDLNSNLILNSFLVFFIDVGQNPLRYGVRQENEGRD